MTTPNLSLSFTFRDLVTGEVEHIEIDWDEVWSLTPPFRPAILNVVNTGKISANDWRHKETGWYDEEHEFLNQLLNDPTFSRRMIAESRLLLYAVFVKTADYLGGITLRKRSSRHFVRKYREFFGKWRCSPSLPPALCFGKQPADPEEYLKAVRPESYAVVRMILQILAGRGLRASRH